MNRRNFFAAVAGFAASLFTLPKWMKAGLVQERRRVRPATPACVVQIIRSIGGGNYTGRILTTGYEGEVDIINGAEAGDDCNLPDGHCAIAVEIGRSSETEQPIMFINSFEIASHCG